MSRRYHSLAFTEDVKAAQTRFGSRAAQDRLDRHAAHPSGESAGPPDEDGAGDPLTEPEREFIASCDGFYLASVSATGWPYVQFRGGPPGFVTALDEHTLGWADFRGNRQYISTGNIGYDARVAMIFMDYPRRLRLKVYGRARLIDVRDLPGAASDLAPAGYPARVEQDVHVDVAAYDWNCQQHITPRYSAEELAPLLEPMRARLSELEEENRRLRAERAPDEGTA